MTYFIIFCLMVVIPVGYFLMTEKKSDPFDDTFGTTNNDGGTFFTPYKEQFYEDHGDLCKIGGIWHTKDSL